MANNFQCFKVNSSHFFFISVYDVADDDDYDDDGLVWLIVEFFFVLFVILLFKSTRGQCIAQLPCSIFKVNFLWFLCGCFLCFLCFF